jgi:ABC-type Fe3+ transport system permease subunit
MRLMFISAPLFLCATSAFAQPPAQQVPPQLTDPAFAEKLANTAQALSKAFLDLPVGEIRAAVEGREPNAADRKLTVRDLGRRDDPNFERNLRRQMAQAKPMIQQSMKALADALPSMMQGLEQAQKSLERAAANMPDPTYPKQ